MVNSELADWSICWQKAVSALTVCLTCFLINEKLTVLNTVGPLCLSISSATVLFLKSFCSLFFPFPTFIHLITFFKLSTWTSIIGCNSQLHYNLSINWVCGRFFSPLLVSWAASNFHCFCYWKSGGFFSLNLFVACIYLLVCTFLPSSVYPCWNYEYTHIPS